MWRLALGLALCCAIGLTDRGGARAQSYSLARSAVVPAGGALFGTDCAMTVAVGQPAAGVQVGGDYSVLSGFWPATFIVESEVGPPLFIQWAPGFVVIYWSWDSTDFVLEATDDLAQRSWRPVTQTNNPAIVPVSGAARFFRLARP